MAAAVRDAAVDVAVLDAAGLEVVFQRFCVTDKTVDIRAETVALDSVS